MRPFLLKALASGLVLLSPCAVTQALPAPQAADSLLSLLPAAREAADRQRIYVQLADLAGDGEQAAPYWEKALGAAQEAGDTYGCKEALDFLVRKFAGPDKQRAEAYIALSDSILPGPRHELFRSSLYAYYIWKQMTDNTASDIVRRELEKLKARDRDALSPEKRIEWEFLTGLFIDYTSLVTEAYGNMPTAIPYVERALRKLEKYPQEERLHLEKICHDELTDLYVVTSDKRAAGEILKCIDLHCKWLAMDTRFPRPDRDTTGYLMHAYSKMLYLHDLITPAQATEYYEKCIRLAREKNDRNEIFGTSARYYEFIGDYKQAIAYIDSTITEYQRTGKKADLSPFYATQSRLYERIKDYRNALRTQRRANTLRYNKRVQEVQSELAEMQTLFNVDRLEMENNQLSDKIRRTVLVAGGILLLLLIGWSIYQYTMVRRLKRIRLQLLAANGEATRQSLRAMESEKMKTAFINSMCHEIRTPLNAINGFSDLLLEEEYDAGTRHEFRKQIWANTTALTTLLENMLELSTLISSGEALPLTETDLGLLCAERLQYYRHQSNNPQVEYIFEGGGNSGPCIIPTNPFYMTRVVDNLLQNAAKFTAAGSITLFCDKDEGERKLRIRVADTGIGIAPDKREWVFDRFTKVDSFKPGSGIGLYLCRLIVTRLGGEIRVCPDYSQGCCIMISLPY